MIHDIIYHLLFIDCLNIHLLISPRLFTSIRYDSDSDISFVQPYGDKKAEVTTQTLLNRITNNATEITNDISKVGKKLVVHATTKIENFVDETFVASDDDDSDEQGGRSRKASRLKKKAMDLILEQTGKCKCCIIFCAHDVNMLDCLYFTLTNCHLLHLIIGVDHTGHCAAILHHVANEIPNPCLELVVRSDDESSDDESSYRGKSRKTRKTKKKKKKKRSEAKAHSGLLSDGISVTTDEKTEYSYSDDDSVTFVDDSAEQRRVATLQRRRAQFLRQRAIERTAEMDEDDDEEEAQYGRPKLTGGFKLTKKSAFPSQELRVPSQELRCDELDKVDISSLTDIRDLPVPSDKSFDSTQAAWSPELFEKDPFSSVLDVDTTAEVSLLLNSSNELELEILKPSPKWSSFSAEFPKLGDSTSHNLILKESHLGATLANTPTTQSGLQLGDVIIRLNGQDVSTLDTSTVSDMIHEMRDSRRITYLRKNVEL